MFKEKPEVLVAGAGPVGLFAALALAKRGVRVQVVDTGMWACSHSYALALHPQSLKLLREIGLEDLIREEAYPVRTVAFCDAAGVQAQMRIDHDNPSAHLAVMRQSTLEDLFESALEEMNVPVLWRHEVASIAEEREHVAARIYKFEKDSRGYVAAHTEWVLSKTFDLNVPLVLGADGHNSQVRRALGLEFPEVGPAQYYAVFEFQSDADLANEMRIVFGEQTTDVLWPLPDGYCRWSFQLLNYSEAEAEQVKDRLLAGGFGHFPTKRMKDRTAASGRLGGIQILDDAHLHALISQRAPWFKAKISNITWRTVARFERRLASSFGRGRAWLAGDAAHLTAPAGVQSMNLGMLEASELAEAYSRILKGQSSLAALRDYNRRWTATWRQLEGLESGLQTTASTDPWIRANVDRFIPCLPGQGEELASLAAQLRLELTPATAQMAAAR